MILLAGGSILAAFFAGSVALFSPCCIVFLLPAYLASAVKGRRWALFPLTLAFAAGLAAIILPLTLGVGILASIVMRNHLVFYLAGGVLMLGLGGLAIAGKSWHMSFRSPELTRTDAPGVFALGVFSGVASSCCAPVLAGVVTLSALAGSIPGSMALGLAYVFGMVFPLFAIALLWDRFHLGERRIFSGRAVTFRVGRRFVNTTTTNIAVGIAFAVMGGAVIVLALLGNPTATPGFQVSFSRWLNDTFAALLRRLNGVPEIVLGVGLLGLAGTVAWLGLSGARRHSSKEAACHGYEADADEDEEGAEPETALESTDAP